MQRIILNKPLATLVLILITFHLIFHDYLIPPRANRIQHIPAWASHDTEVIFSLDDPDLLLAQIAWLVKSLQRRAVRGEGLQIEIQHLQSAQQALQSGQKKIESRLAQLDQWIHNRPLAAELQTRHQKTATAIRQNLEEVKQNLLALKKDVESYEKARTPRLGLNWFRRNHYKNRIFKQGERILALIYSQDKALASRPLVPVRLPTQVPRISLAHAPTLAQLDSDQNTRLASLAVETLLGGVAFAADPPGSGDMGETLETLRTSAIVNLAEHLNHDPVRLYEYVRNQIDFLPTTGSVQGAEATLRSGRGNDVDQASLLIALFRSSGLPARYVHGMVEIPVSKVKSWVGSEDANTAISVFNRNGVLAKVGVSQGDYATIEIEHTWVRAYLPYEPHRGAGRGKSSYWVDLDPSFKQYDSSPYLDVANEIGVDPWSFLVSIKEQATVSEEQSYAHSVPEDLIIDKLDEWADRVERYAQANSRQPENLYQTRRIVPEHLQALPSTLPYKVLGNPVSSPTLDSSQSYTVAIKLLNPDNSVSLSYNTNLLEIDHHRVTLAYTPATSKAQEVLNQSSGDPEVPAYLIDVIPHLLIDGATVASATIPVQMATDQYLSVTLSGPNLVPSEAIRPVPAGSYLALVFDPQGISAANLYTELDDLRQVWEDLNSGSPTSSLDQVLGRTLHVIGLAYFQELDRMTGIAAAALRVHASRQPSFLTVGYEVVGDQVFGVPLTAQARRLAVSIDRNSFVPVSLTGTKADEKQFMVIAGLTASALEHNVLVQTTGGEAASSLRLVQAASTSGMPVYTVTAQNYESVLAQLPNLPPDVALHVADAAHANMIVTVPQEPLDYAGYHGIGYVVYDPASGNSGYFLQGRLAGGVRPADFLSASDLITLGQPDGYLSLLEPTLGWIALAQDVTTSVSWRYSPAISAINNWFRTGDQLDKVTFIAAGIAISGPIGVLTERAEIAQFTVIPTLFSPNNDGYLDTVSISAGISRPSSWRVSVLDGSTSTPVRQFTGTGQQINLLWDGTNQTGAPLPDGNYTINADATALGKTIPARTQSANIEIDTTPPVAQITKPLPNASVSGVVSVVGNADDKNFTGFKLELACTGDWQTLNAEASPRLLGTLGVFDSTLYPAGDCTLRLTATDAVGLSSTHQITVTNTAQGQAAPVLAIQAPTEGATLSGVTPVTVWAIDDLFVDRVEIYVNGKLLQTLYQADPPDYYTTDLNTSAYPNGPLTITAKAYDQRGSSSEDSISVIADNTISNLSAVPALFTPDGDGKDDTVTLSAQFTGTADWTLEITKADDGSLLKFFSGSGAALNQVWDGKDSSGVIPKNAAFDCLALVTLASGDTASTTFRLETVNRPPELVIHSPKDQQAITSPTDIFATIKDTDLVSWKLEYAEVMESYSASDWTLLASGTAPVINKSVSKFDPTQLKNNPYLLRLSAKDTENPEAALYREVFVSGELKIGLFTLSFEDLTVPLGGLPITVGRTYSSIERMTKGEFSYGWKMFIRDVDVKEDGNRNVTMTLPDGRRVTFYYQLKPQNAVTYRATWNAEAGVYDQLAMTVDNRVLVDAWNGQILGFFHDYLAYVEPTPYEESIIPGYLLTTKDGMQYLVKREVKGTDPVTDRPIYGELHLISVQDLNGNRLFYDEAGIHYGCDASGHNCIEEVLFTRDVTHGNRITAISDPAGNNITYSYNTSGDLEKVTFQDGSNTRFIYQDHYLTEIIDPLGHRAIRNEYDAEGRLIAHVDADGNRVEYTHKPDTKQEIIRDRLGNITVYEYDNRGNILTEINALGNRTEFAYDLNNNKIREVDALGNTRTWSYDNRGNILVENDPLGNATRYKYDTQGNLLGTTDAMGHISTNEFDAKRNLVRSVDTLGNEKRYEYNSMGIMTRLIYALGYSTIYGYDSKGRQISATDAKGNTSYTTYDTMGNAILVKDRRGYETHNTYDNRGRLLTSTNALGTVTHYEYNAAGMQTAVIDSTGARTEVVYDNLGRAIEEHYPDGTATKTEYDLEGSVIANIDQTGARTQTIYDALGRAVKIVQADGSITETTYDSLGRAIQTKDPRGNITTSEYDVLGRTIRVIDALGNVTTYEYDSLGRQVGIIDANRNRWRAEYNASGRKVATIYPDGTRYSIEYDALGRKIAEIDQSGIKTEFEYDALGRLVSTTDAEGGITRYEYDAIGNLTAIIDPNSNRTEFGYDPLGRKIWRKLPEGQKEYWDYADCCSIATLTDFNGATISYEYDSMGKEIRAIYPDGSIVQFSYNTLGEIAKVTSNLGERKYSYDQHGRLIREDKEDGQFIAYQYDSLGTLVRLDYSGGHSISYEYDHFGRLSTVVSEAGAFIYEYDNLGRNTRLTYPNATQARYTYDDLGRIIFIEHKAKDGEIASFEYSFDPIGNAIKIVQNGSSVWEYSYDKLYRLKRESLKDNYFIEYEYDVFGNRVKQNYNGLITEYKYNKNDQLIEEIKLNDITQYNYDMNGNIISKIDVSEQLTYEWSYDNKLINLLKNGQPMGRFIYDYQGDRVKRISKDGEVNYLMDNNNLTGYSQVLRKNTNSAEIVNYIYADDLLAQNRHNIRNYYHYDRLGSSRILSNSAGNFIDVYDYFAYGEIQNTTGTSQNNYLFTGEQFEELINGFYLRARYYNSTIGRFASMDPILETTSMNRYIYVNDNPVNSFDYSGFYGPKIHRDKTFEFMNKDLKLKCSEEIENDIADADALVDRLHRLDWQGWHFVPYEQALFLVKEQLSTCDAKKFGQRLHTFQDTFSHCQKTDSCDKDPSHGGKPYCRTCEGCQNQGINICLHPRPPKDVTQKSCDNFEPCDAGTCDKWREQDGKMRDEVKDLLREFEPCCLSNKTRKLLRMLAMSTYDIGDLGTVIFTASRGGF